MGGRRIYELASVALVIGGAGILSRHAPINIIKIWPALCRHGRCPCPANDGHRQQACATDQRQPHLRRQHRAAVAGPSGVGLLYRLLASSHLYSIHTCTVQHLRAVQPSTHTNSTSPPQAYPGDKCRDPQPTQAALLTLLLPLPTFFLIILQVIGWYSWVSG